MKTLRGRRIVPRLVVITTELESCLPVEELAAMARMGWEKTRVVGVEVNVPKETRAKARKKA